jgi:aryl-alcohol dehydrogenase-like predicted oxidoreductase
MLSGKYTSQNDVPEGSRAARGEKLIQNYFKDENFGKVEAYKHVAVEHDVNLSQFSLAWILNQPTVTSAIIGASKPHHVTDAAQISDWIWSDELKQRVNIL